MARKNVNSDDAPEEKETPQKPQRNSEEEIHKLVAEKAAEEEAEIKKAEEEEKNPKKEEPEIEVDIDKLKEETQKETIEKVTKEIVEPLKKQIDSLSALGKTKQEKSELRRELEAMTKKASDEGREVTYDEALEFVTNKSSELAVAKIEEKRQKEAEKQEKLIAEQKKANEEQNEKNFAYWQGQLSEMEQNGLIPEMKEQKEGDAGFDARVKMYALMQETWKSEAPIANLYEVYNKLYTKETVNKQPAGADAPVNMGGMSGSAPSDDKSFKYSEIAGASRDLEGFLINELKKASNS